MDYRNRTLLNKDFILITVLGFFFFFNFHSFLLLPPYLAKLGATEKTVGFVMGIAGISTLALTPSVGKLADRYGKKIFISSGLLLLAISTLPFAFLDEIGFEMYFLRIIHGAAFSLFFIAAGALTADISPVAKRAQAIGLYGVFTIINYAIAPFAGSLLIKNFSFKYYIMVLTTVGFTGFLISLSLPGHKGVTGKKINYNQWHYIDYLKNINTLIPATTLFVLGGGFIATLNFISIFSLSVEIESFYLFFVFYTLSVLFVRLFFGWVPDYYGKWLVSSPSVAVFGLSVLILAFTSQLMVLIFAAVLFGIGHGFAYPSIYTIIIESASDNSRARSFAISSLAFTSGGMTGSFLFGIIADYFGYKWMFISISFSILLMFLFFNFHVLKTRLTEAANG